MARDLREEEEAEIERQRARMVRAMRLPRLGRDTRQKLVTRICVEATEEELGRWIAGRSPTAEEIIEWARQETTSASLAQRARWKAFWSLQPRQ